MLLCKAEDPAVASATAIDDNEAEKYLDKQKLRHFMTEVITITSEAIANMAVYIYGVAYSIAI